MNTTATTLAVITARGLINGAWFQLSIGGNIYSVQSQAEVRDGIIHINFRMTAELKAILAAATTATSGKGYLCF